MHFGARERIRFIALLVALVAVGLTATVYVLVKQRFPNPLRDTYTIEATLTEADGVVAGLGQPVNVAGVRVGSVVDTRHDAAGNAIVRLEIERDELAAVHANARLTLEPITPLKDMQLALDPGDDSAPRLGKDGMIGLEQTAIPVPLDTLLSSLDADTRTFLSSLLGSLQEGTRDRGTDLRASLRALGPTTAQVRRITRALEGRRRELARLVHNLNLVTDAAAQDGNLVRIVAAGEATLRAVAGEEAPLRAAIERLPGTLVQARTTLGNAARFSEVLQPALERLEPASAQLEGALRELTPFASDATVALREQIRPLVREVYPTLTSVNPAVRRLSHALPDLFDGLQSTNYLLNSFAFNPPGNDEGGLFWVGMMLHNFNSVFSLGEAHGGAGRASVLLSCQQMSNTADLGRIIKLAVGSPSVCPD